MGYKKKLKSVFMVSTIFSMLLAFGCAAVSTNEVPQESRSISIPLDIASAMKTKDIEEVKRLLSLKLLKTLFPEIKNPRFMTEDDILYSTEKRSFIYDGYSFLLRDDYNNDGFTDLALACKYDNPIYPHGGDVFVGLLSIQGSRLVRDVFRKGNSNLLYLKKLPDYKPNIIGIQITDTSLSTEYFAVLYWTGGEYRFQSYSYNENGLD